jgi:hypothetical protein
MLEKLVGIQKILDSLIQSILVSLTNVLLQPYISNNYKFDPQLLKLKNELLITIQLLGKLLKLIII